LFSELPSIRVLGNRLAYARIPARYRGVRELCSVLGVSELV